MRRCGAFIGTLMAIVLAAQSQAAQVTTPIQGSFGKAENTCVSPIAIFLSLNCGFSGGPMFPADLNAVASIGPLDSGGFYASAAAAPGYAFSTTPGTDFAGTPLTSFLVGLPATPGDGKVELPITGSIVIDDLGDGFGANDTIAGTIVLGPGARLASGSGSAAGSATITESWTSITHMLPATPVSSATANGAGGFDYVLGSDGFPTNIFTAADEFASEAAADSDDVAANSPWLQANGGSGFNYDSMTDSGTDIVRFGLKSGPRANVGGATTAVITGLVCSDVGLAPVEADSMGNPVVDTMTDCQSSSVAWGVEDPADLNAGKLNAGFDNLVLKLSTNASGTILSANAYYTMEYPILGVATSDNTWVGGTLEFNKAPPVANDDGTNPAEVNIPVSLDVLLNDEDIQSTPLTINIESNPSFGTAAAVDTGGGTPASIRINYTYTATTVNATDSFTYSITDDTLDNSNTATATVQITNKLPTAVDDSGSVDELQAINVAVLGNDDPGDLPTAVVTKVSNPTLGSATVEPDLTITYTSTGGTGADTFDYTLTDYNGDVSAPATVSITVCTVGSICAVDDFVSTNAQTLVNINPLLNDAGLAVDLPLAVIITAAPTKGTIGVITGCDAQGTCVVPYTPNAGQVGDDTFDYEVSNSAVPPVTATATVTVTINDIPVAADDGSVGAPFATVPNGGSANLAVLANDSGLQDVPLTVTFPAGPSNGSLTQAGCNAMATCSVTYLHNGAVGVDTFMYTVTDKDGDADTATVTVLVNDQPVAVADSAAVAPNGSVNIPVLQNDSGLSDTPLMVSATPPASGSVTVENNNTVTYLNGGTPGVDTFSYTVTDKDGDNDTATVTVTVADLNVPLAVNDTVNSNRGKAVTIDVLANDSGLDDTPITLELIGSPGNGTVVINGSPANDVSDIEVIYLPDDDFLGLDTFEYLVTDNNGDFDTATVTVNVLDDEVVLRLPSGNNSSAISPWSLMILAWLLWFRQRRLGIESA